MSKFDEIRNGHKEEKKPEGLGVPWMGCPECHGTSGRLTVGRQRFAYCTEDRLFWDDGVNPWSEPFAKLDESQRRQWKEAGLENFTQTIPWMLGRVDKA
jgi:hypothetical protein